MINTIKETGYFFVRNARNNLRNPIWIVIQLSAPLLYVFFFAPLLVEVAGDYANMADTLSGFIPGLLMFVVLSVSIGSGWDAIHDLRDGVLERFYVAPTNRMSYLFGQITFRVVKFLVLASVVLLIALPFGFRVNFGGLVLQLLLLSLVVMFLASMSIALALWIKQSNGYAMVESGIQLPITLLAGVLLPLSLGPRWLQIVGYVNPLFWVVEASRSLAIGDFSNISVWLSFVIVLPLLFSMMFFATHFYKRSLR